jgi:hypothetical protein
MSLHLEPLLRFTTTTTTTTNTGVRARAFESLIHPGDGGRGAHEQGTTHSTARLLQQPMPYLIRYICALDAATLWMRPQH